MIKKIYSISGFDCPNCASKAESHLSREDGISFVHLDFSKNKLYITYENDVWSIEKLKDKIAEVETNKIRLVELENKKEKEPIFNKRMKWVLTRIITVILITLVCIFALGNKDLNWLRFGLYLFALSFIGYDIFYKVIIHIKNKANILDHNLLIFIAALGSLVLAIIGLIDGENPLHVFNNGYSIALDDTMEGVMVITLFQIGVIIENVATNKSKAAITNAVELRVDKANKIVGEDIEIIEPEKLVINDKILVKTGEMIPIDGKIISGEGLIDMSSLTGEFVPVKASENLDVYSGCLLKEGSIIVLVNKLYEDSAVSKVIKLIESGGEKKSKADEFIAKFAKWYTPIVVLAAILTLLIGGLISSINGDNEGWKTWVHTGLEVLVIGCPCAIVISVPLAYFSALGLASKHGIVVKGGNYLDKLANLGTLVTDKTGTLTHGSFTIQKIVPYKDINEETLLDNLLIVEHLSTHPIGKAIMHDYKNKKIPCGTNFIEIAGLGCEIKYKNSHIYAGNDKLMASNGIKHDLVNETGTIVYCAKDDTYLGYVLLADSLKEDAQPMVNLLHSEKVEILLLTGDHEDNAKDICNKLGIDRWYSNLLPEEKTVKLEEEMNKSSKAIAFIGDGINDAPSIIRSDIGIAMGAIGSDIAVENADVIIMNDDPSKVYDAMKIAKKGRYTSIFNIVFALSIKIVVFILALIFKDASWMMYVAVAADTGLTVLLVINSLLLLYRPVKRKVK